MVHGHPMAKGILFWPIGGLYVWTQTQSCNKYYDILRTSKDDEKRDDYCSQLTN